MSLFQLDRFTSNKNYNDDNDEDYT